MKHLTFFENYNQADSFKQWFGASTVVDAGKPLVVYHGTSADFDDFDTTTKTKNFKQSILGFYFTNIPKGDWQRGWADDTNASAYAANAGDNPSVMPVYLRILNPMRLKADGWGSPVVALDKQKGDIAYWLSNEPGKYDGIICEFEDKEEYGDERVFVTFEPIQIKSAIGNRGSYLPSSNNITESAQCLTLFESFDPYTATNLTTAFLQWLSIKLGRTLSKENRLGHGVEGDVYSLDDHRVIKLTSYPLDTYAYLANKNIKGVTKVYNVGTIKVPMRFKGDKEAHDQHMYNGIRWLDPNNTDGWEDNRVNYAIMERVYPSAELSTKIRQLDHVLWNQFLRHRAGNVDARDMKSMCRANPSILGFGDEANALLVDSMHGYAVDFMKTFTKGVNEEIATAYHDYVQLKAAKLRPLYDQLVIIFRNLQAAGILWEDCHDQNFGFNKKKKVVAFDIGTRTKFNIPNKTVIRESKD